MTKNFGFPFCSSLFIKKILIRTFSEKKLAILEELAEKDFLLNEKEFFNIRLPLWDANFSLQMLRVWEEAKRSVTLTLWHTFSPISLDNMEFILKIRKKGIDFENENRNSQNLGLPAIFLNHFQINWTKLSWWGKINWQNYILLNLIKRMQ